MRARGDAAEAHALRFLVEHGLVPITANFSCRLGEIDLIMRDGDTLVFVEVRQRTKTRFGSPLDSISMAKCQKLRRTAQVYLQKSCPHGEPPCRFDVVAITGSPDSGSIQWIKGAL